MMVTLRPYQQRALDRAREAIERGIRRLLMVSPTGTGKTELYLAMATRAIQMGHQVLVLAPQIELVEQPSRKLDARGVDHGVIQADHWRRRPYCPIQIATVQTLARRGAEGLNPALVIADEAHLYVAETFRRVVDQWPNAIVVGFTASPARLDGRGLDELFEELHQVITIREAIADQWLVPIRTFSVDEPDLSQVRLSHGEFNQRELQAMCKRPERVGDVVKTWMRLGRGRPTILFAQGIEDSRGLVAAFVAAGVRAVHVDGTTPAAIRARYQAELAGGELEVLSNAQLLTLGVDIPAVSCIIMGRSTASEMVFIQEGGRGLRPHPGKQDLLLLDHAGNVTRHGLLEWDREWTLDGIRKPKREEVPGIRTCKLCFAVSPATCEACVSCGAAFPKKPRILATRAGELREVRGAKEYGARATPEQRARTLAKWIEESRERGYKSGWVSHRFEAVFGAQPGHDDFRAALEIVGLQRASA